jgi:hypothetical protein
VSGRIRQRCRNKIVKGLEGRLVLVIEDELHMRMWQTTLLPLHNTDEGFHLSKDLPFREVSELEAVQPSVVGQ